MTPHCPPIVNPLGKPEIMLFTRITRLELFLRFNSKQLLRPDWKPAGRGQRTTGFALSMRDWEGIDKLWKAAGAPVESRWCTFSRASLFRGQGRRD